MNTTLLIPNYRGVHQWMQYHYGKPKKCSRCGFTSDNGRQFHWANLSGQYLKDITDWKRLCVSCHLRMDRKKSCLKGHTRTKQNTYVVRQTGAQQCKVCKSKARRLYRERTGK